MNIDTVIDQLKALAPIFRGNVAGSASWAAVEDQTWLSYPAAYVVIGDTTAGENQSMTDLRQVVTEAVAIIVAFDNSTDRRGQSVAAQYPAVRAQIRTAILNWRPDWNPTNPSANRETRGFREATGTLLRSDRGRLFYEWVYELDTLVTGLDGWQLTGVPLQVQGSITDPTSGATTAQFAVATNPPPSSP